jgi:hypothetical protein
MTRRPNLFLIGAPKAGTTSLYSYLEGHPAIFMSPVKEPNFFSTDVKATFRRSQFMYPDEIDGYVELFEGARDETWVGEASTSYLASRVAPHSVRDFAPDAAILVMVRNPVDLVYSLHNERVSNGAEPIIDFEEAMAADEDRRAGRRLPPGFNELGAVYRDNALLGEQLQRWQSAFGSERVHATVFSDFAADTPRAFRRVLDFLGVDSGYVPASFEAQNASWRRRDGVMRRMVKSGPMQWLRHSVLPAFVGEKAAFRMSRRYTRSRFNRRAYARPQMRPELRRELEDWFAPDVALLGELIDRDLITEWFDRPSANVPRKSAATAP